MLQGETKIYQSDGRHSIYVPAGLIKDSAFPFTLEDTLQIRIEPGRIVVEKAKGKKG